MIRLLRPRPAARHAQHRGGILVGPGVDRLIAEALARPALPLAAVLAGHLPPPMPTQYRCGVCRDGSDIPAGIRACFRCGVAVGGVR